VTAGKNNIVIFVILDGEPCDDNSHLLAKDNKVFAIKDVTLGRARASQCRYLIVVKIKLSTLLKQKAFKEVLRSLYDDPRIKFTNNIRFQNRYPGLL